MARRYALNVRGERIARKNTVFPVATCVARTFQRILRWTIALPRQIKRI